MKTLLSKEYRKKYRLNNPIKMYEQDRKSKLKKLYGLSLQDYDTLLENQKNCCAICGQHQAGFKKRLAVDHDHITSKIRGLLCMNCNHILGKAKDSIDTLQRAINYLRENTNEE